MKNDYKEMVLQNIESVKDPLKKSTLLKLNYDFEEYPRIIRNIYYLKVEDWQNKEIIEKFHKRYNHSISLDEYIADKANSNINLFYNYYIDTCYYVLGNEQDKEYIQTIEKYIFNICLESINENLSDYSDLTFNNNLRHDSTQKYMIYCFKEILDKKELKDSLNYFTGVYERYKTFNLLHQKYNFNKLETFLSGLLDIIKKKIELASYNENENNNNTLNITNNITNNKVILNKVTLFKEIGKEVQEHKFNEDKKNENKTPSKANAPIKSFTLKNEYNLCKLSGIHECLFNDRIIDKKDSKYFNRLFMGKPIKHQINFNSLVDLACFINLLLIKYKVINKTSIIKQVCHCFTVKGKQINTTSYQSTQTEIRKYLKGDPDARKPNNLDLIDKIIESVKLHTSD